MTSWPRDLNFWLKMIQNMPLLWWLRGVFIQPHWLRKIPKSKSVRRQILSPLIGGRTLAKCKYFSFFGKKVYTKATFFWLANSWLIVWYKFVFLAMVLYHWCNGWGTEVPIQGHPKNVFSSEIRSLANPKKS